MSDNPFIENQPFFLSKPAPCPYIEGLTERKIITWLDKKDSEPTHQSLLDAGFRRSQTMMYKPHCANCSACVPLRIRVENFRPSQSQKRISKKNRHVTRKITSSHLKPYHFKLYQKYINARHPGGDMAQMSLEDVAQMVQNSNIDSCLIEYYADHQGHQKCVAWCLTDQTPHGLSMGYTVHDPDFQKNGLGNYAILDHIALAKSFSYSYVYLGYWIANSQKMAYKKQFKPNETFIGYHWQENT